MELQRSVEISNKYGLHARASTRLAELAKEFQSKIFVSKQAHDEEVDAKSILGVLTLGVAKGQTLNIRCVGMDAEEAMTALVGLVEQKFDEE